MAAFCLLGVLLALGAVALAGLRPWATDSLVPDLSVSPGLGAALEDAVAVAPGQSGGVAAGRVAPPGPALTVASAVPAPAQGATSELLAVAPARAVGGAVAAPISTPPPSAPPTPAPAAPDPAPAPIAAAPAPAPAPQASPTQPPVTGVGGGSGSPGTAAPGEVGPPPECEGEEYTVTVSFEIDPENYEESPAEILIQRLESDGTVSELRIEGSLSDARGLIELLVAEGSCVEVVLEPISPELEATPEYLPD